MEILRVYPKDIAVVLEMPLSEIDKLLDFFTEAISKFDASEHSGEMRVFIIDLYERLSDVSQTVRQNHGT